LVEEEKFCDLVAIPGALQFRGSTVKADACARLVGYHRHVKQLISLFHLVACLPEHRRVRYRVRDIIFRRPHLPNLPEIVVALLTWQGVDNIKLVLHGLVFALAVQDEDRCRCGALYVQMIVERRLTSRRKAHHVKRGSVEIDRFGRAGKTCAGRTLQKGSRRVAEPIHCRNWRLVRIFRLQFSFRRPTTYGEPNCRDQHYKTDIHEWSSQLMFHNECRADWGLSSSSLFCLYTTR